MPKTNCNIIKDLLPSYIDGICSPESEALIKEHMTECQNCQKLYEHMRTELVSVNTSDAKKVDYFKKIQRNISHKNIIMYGIIAFLFLLQIYLNINGYRFVSELSMYFNYLFPIITSGLLFVLLPEHAEHEVPVKLKFTILGIEFAATTYILFLLLYTIKLLADGKTLLNMHPMEIGPFLNIQIGGLIAFFIIAFVLTLILSIRKKSICPALHFLPLGGISLMFEYQRFLESLTKPEMNAIINPYLAFSGEVVLLVGIYMIVNRKNAYH